ncbi:MAG: hypothetical protein M3167_07825, partial [Acidobacteriota bacterium]|nr:hypothetical protein [Acidobacteriota bacterium]
LGFDAILGAVSFASRKPARDSAARRERFDRRTVALLAVAAAGTLLFLIQAAAAPPNATDYLAIWGLKGRTIAESGSIPGRLFHDPALAWAHPEYPLLVSLTLAATARFAGGWSETGVVVFYVFCQAATLAALFGFRARRGSTLRGALAAALAALCVGLYARGNVGTAEIPMALGFVLLAEAFLDSLAEDRGSLARLSIAAFFCASTKNEGAVLAVLLALWGLLGSGVAGRVRLRTAFAATLPGVAHAAILRLATGPVRARDFDLGLLQPARWGELPPRLSEAALRIFSVSLLPAIPAILAIGVFFLVTRRGDADVLLPALALQVLVYAAACAFSAFSVRWHVDSSFSRITLALFPAAALVMAGRRLPERTARRSA